MNEWMDEWGGVCGDTAADTTNKRKTKKPPKHFTKSKYLHHRMQGFYFGYRVFH